MTVTDKIHILKKINNFTIINESGMSIYRLISVSEDFLHLHSIME